MITWREVPDGRFPTSLPRGASLKGDFGSQFLKRFLLTGYSRKKKFGSTCVD